MRAEQLTRRARIMSAIALPPACTLERWGKVGRITVRDLPRGWRLPVTVLLDGRDVSAQTLAADDIRGVVETVTGERLFGRVVMRPAGHQALDRGREGQP